MDEIICFGGAVKALGDGKIGGHLIRFGSPSDIDLENDFFTKSTDYAVDWSKEPISAVYYNHGFDPTLKHRVLGSGSMKMDDVGVWIEAQLAMRDEYEKAIYQLAEAGKLGWSSGTAGHLLDRKNYGNVNEITRWPLGLDASLTPTPAEYRNAVVSLKTWSESLTGDFIVGQVVEQKNDDEKNNNEQSADIAQTVTAETETPKDTTTVSAAVDGDAAQKDVVSEQPVVTATVKSNGVKPAPSGDKKVMEIPYVTVSDLDAQLAKFADLIEKKFTTARTVEPTPVIPPTAPTASEGGDTKTLNAKIEQLLAFIEGSPRLKSAGYVTDDGGKKDPNVKSFGDFLLAIKRRDNVRLTSVYGATKDMSGTDGATGGVLVPEEYRNELLAISERQSPILSRVTTIPVNSDHGKWPALDNSITPTAGTGQTAAAGGVSATATAAGAALTETQPTFKMIEWTISKVGGYTEVENELISDSPQAIEVLLRNLFGIAISAKSEYFVLRGSGAGEPLGVLSAPAAIGLAPATNNLFAYGDALNMLSRFMQVSNGQPVWLWHKSIWPDVGIFGTNSAVAWVNNMAAAPATTLLGYPYFDSQHLPKADTSGCVALADLGAYLLFDRAGLSIAFSEHAAFTTDKGTWRFTRRMDGQPWLTSAVTDANPGGSYTLSPFVYLND